ncbi:MAG TPA: serine/threonine-protein kinase, partial [Elusimicrobiales bacterium]|nr:serine/threonine-protein kinase [Elusimicrobiales bacterium]
MKKFLFSDTLWGALLTLSALFFYLTGSGIETLELKFYDLRANLRSEAVPGQDIAIIEIDDESVSRIGRWPWPRSRMAEMLVFLSTPTARPSAIGLNVLFSEPEKNADLDLAGRVAWKYSELRDAKKIRETTKGSEFLEFLDRARSEADNDAKLGRAIGDAGNVVLPLFFGVGEVLSKPEPEPGWLSALAAPVSQAQGGLDIPYEGASVTAPVEVLGSSAAGAGHVNVFSDVDGAVRKESPFIPYNDSYYPSFAVELVRVHLGLPTSDTLLKPGEFFSVGKRTVRMDASSSLLISFSESRSYKYYSFYDVLNGKVVPDAFKGKIVLIGPTAQGVGSLYVTPVGKNLPAVEFTANVVDSVLRSNFITRPPWGGNAELGLLLLTGLFITFALPRLKALLGAVLTAVLLAGFVGAGVFLFTSKALWLKTMYPSLLLVTGYIFVISKRFFTTEKRKELIEVSQIETNKMLGLSFQGQGMLDLAFEKFRLCPLDDNMKDTLYNLALDFERKRQYNKAVAVYEHISGRDPEFKDIKTKIDLLKKAADGAVFGGVGGKGGGGDATMMVAGSSTTPTLGRYEIKKELGKGAMGIVYLGVDPKINRTVAIKTMRFEEGLDEKAMKELKDRFFREAQAAGNLTHPHIVKIYDAGEEQDIAYIAMELLKGDDLKKWAAKDSLLPVEKVLEYIAHAADALAYAHKSGIVHRDIKPANIMLLEDGTIRVADFGIARITESSKTATGTVLGTPYYMSPEQIAGKKVDGRADLFSLGVTLYELLTGERPWKGGESIGTLLFQITSDPYPDPFAIRPDLPKDILAVIDKALKKKPEERFQTGTEMAQALRDIMAGRKPTIPEGSAPAAAPSGPSIPQATPAPRPQTASPAPAPKPAAAPQAQAVPRPAAAPQPAPKPAPKAAPAPAP